MVWSEVRKDYPDIWVVIESMKSQVENNEVAAAASRRQMAQRFKNYRKLLSIVKIQYLPQRLDHTHFS